MGIDPRILGKSRVSNITSRVKANDLRLNGHKDSLHHLVLTSYSTSL